jgi:tetratricopeptide (TPR) repeat protein
MKPRVLLGAAVALPILALTLCAQTSAFSADVRLVEPIENKSQQQELQDLLATRQALQNDPRSAGALVAYGSALQALGELDPASQAFEHALTLEPRNAKALYGKGLILADQNEWAKAIDVFGRALDSKPDYAAAHLALGEMLLRTGDFERSKKELVSVLRLEPRSAGAYAGLGLIDLQAGNFESARRDFQQALEFDPGYVEAQKGMARTLSGQHKWAEAISLLKTIVATDRDSSQERFALGTALSAVGQRSDAQAQFARAHELSNRELIRLRAQGESNSGVAFRNQGKLPEAGAAFRRSIAEDPAYCEAYDNLGGILWLEKDPAAALKQFQTAVGCDPNLASARNNLGNALLYSQHDLDAAIDQFRAAVVLRPAFALARFNLAKALAGKQDFRAAEPEFRYAIAIDPAMAAAHVGLGLLLATEKGSLSEEASAEIQKGLELDPSLRQQIPAPFQAQLH